jgi:hypothetical protein
MTKQEYYDHLCDIGLPSLIAASMADQSSQGARDGATNLMSEEVYAFCSWVSTREGFDFWLAIIDCLK